MTFNPGDKVRDTTVYTVNATIGLPDGSQELLIQQPVAKHSSAFRLAEPSVTHRELREACLRLYAGQHEFGPEFVLGERSALLQLFESLTGSELEMEGESP